MLKVIKVSTIPSGRIRIHFRDELNVGHLLICDPSSKTIRYFFTNEIQARELLQIFPRIVPINFVSYFLLVQDIQDNLSTYRFIKDEGLAAPVDPSIW